MAAAAAFVFTAVFALSYFFPFSSLFLLNILRISIRIHLMRQRFFNVVVVAIFFSMATVSDYKHDNLFWRRRENEKN